MYCTCTCMVKRLYFAQGSYKIANHITVLSLKIKTCIKDDYLQN